MLFTLSHVYWRHTFKWALHYVRNAPFTTFSCDAGIKTVYCFFTAASITCWSVKFPHCSNTVLNSHSAVAIFCRQHRKICNPLLQNLLRIRKNDYNRFSFDWVIKKMSVAFFKHGVHYYRYGCINKITFYMCFILYYQCHKYL